jgi:hypothetical protein
VPPPPWESLPRYRFLSTRQMYGAIKPRQPSATPQVNMKLIFGSHVSAGQTSMLKDARAHPKENPSEDHRSGGEFFIEPEPNSKNVHHPER